MLFLSHLSIYRLVVRPIIGHSKWATAKKNGICLFFNPLQFSFEGGVVTISSLRKFPIITVHTTTTQHYQGHDKVHYKSILQKRMQAEEQWLALLEEQPLRFAIVHSKMADGQYMYVDCSGLSTLCVKDSSKKRRENPFFVTQI